MYASAALVATHSGAFSKPPLPPLSRLIAVLKHDDGNDGDDDDDDDDDNKYGDEKISLPYTLYQLEIAASRAPPPLVFTDLNAKQFSVEWNTLTVKIVDVDSLLPLLPTTLDVATAATPRAAELLHGQAFPTDDENDDGMFSAAVNVVHRFKHRVKGRLL
jgi:hypothetical protein